jgi:hypothetical protein
MNLSEFNPQQIQEYQFQIQVPDHPEIHVKKELI